MESFIKKNIKIIGGLPYEEIGDITVGTATTSVSFTGLDIGKDDDYLLVSDAVSNNATGSELRIYVNNNVTATNYWFQYLAAGVSVSAGRVNRPNLSALGGATGNRFFTNAKLKLTNSGYFVCQTNGVDRTGASTLDLATSCTTSTFTSTSITSIILTAGTTNGIGVGSRFQLYKLVAEKVADITVGTATTSVDITGLNIGKDGEYVLVSEHYSPLATYLSLYFNNNVTATNYYRQSLYAYSTTVGGTRANDALVDNVAASKNTLIASRIKLTNSGYIVCQNENITNIGSGASACEIGKYYTTSTFTSTSITQLTITSSVANAIGIGSRFQLYRIK